VNQRSQWAAQMLTRVYALTTEDGL
jgi:hypothetical protein